MFDPLSISLGHRATVFAFCSKPSLNLIKLLNSLPGSRSIIAQHEFVSFSSSYRATDFIPCPTVQRTRITACSKHPLGLVAQGSAHMRQSQIFTRINDGESLWLQWIYRGNLDWNHRAESLFLRQRQVLFFLNYSPIFIER